MGSHTYFFDKAEQCRRLAADITARDDSAIVTLRALAAEFETKARHAMREADAVRNLRKLPAG